MIYSSYDSFKKITIKKQHNLNSNFYNKGFFGLFQIKSSYLEFKQPMTKDLIQRFLLKMPKIVTDFSTNSTFSVEDFLPCIDVMNYCISIRNLIQNSSGSSLEELSENLKLVYLKDNLRIKDVTTMLNENLFYKIRKSLHTLLHW